jgi:subtilisin-like proprotein convertase family protein
MLHLRYRLLFCAFWAICGCSIAATAAPAPRSFYNAGASVISESVTNNIIEPSESITLRLAIKNVGPQRTSNLVATIQSSGGVTNPVAPSQTYGVIDMLQAEARDFSFEVNAPNNAVLSVVLRLSEGETDRGSVGYKFRVGPIISRFGDSTAATIPDFGVTIPYPFAISVSNVVGSIVKVSATLSNLSHTFPDDLDILLVSPAGDPVMLMSDAGESTDINNQTLIFTVDAGNTAPDGPGGFISPLRASNYGDLLDRLPAPAPLGPFATTMAAFNGRNPNGSWKLYVTDDEPIDGGHIGGWSLTLFTYTPGQLQPKLKTLGLSGDGGLRLHVRGEAQEPYSIEASTDCLTFDVVHSFIMPADGEYLRDEPLTGRARFFRVVFDP